MIFFDSFLTQMLILYTSITECCLSGGTWGSLLWSSLSPTVNRCGLQRDVLENSDSLVCRVLQTKPALLFLRFTGDSVFQTYRCLLAVTGLKSVIQMTNSIWLTCKQ